MTLFGCVHLQSKDTNKSDGEETSLRGEFFQEQKYVRNLCGSEMYTFEPSPDAIMYSLNKYDRCIVYTVTVVLLL